MGAKKVKNIKKPVKIELSAMCETHDSHIDEERQLAWVIAESMKEGELQRRGSDENELQVIALDGIHKNNGCLGERDAVNLPEDLLELVKAREALKGKEETLAREVEQLDSELRKWRTKIDKMLAGGGSAEKETHSQGIMREEAITDMEEKEERPVIATDNGEELNGNVKNAPSIVGEMSELNATSEEYVHMGLEETDMEEKEVNPVIHTALSVNMNNEEEPIGIEKERNVKSAQSMKGEMSEIKFGNHLTRNDYIEDETVSEVTESTGIPNKDGPKRLELERVWVEYRPAKSATKKWRECTVVEEEKNCLKIHYISFHPKYDEWLDKDDPRLKLENAYENNETKL